METSELTPEAERLVIRKISMSAEAQCKEGDTFYLITHRWWRDWLDYVNQDTSSTTTDGLSVYGADYGESSGSTVAKRPSGIDNSDLIYDVTSEDSNGEIELHDSLVEGRDYILLPEEVWKQLYVWYEGGPALARKAICSGVSYMELAVEVYPLRLHLLVMPKGDQAVIRISKKETVRELHRRACLIFDLSLEQVCVWDYYGHQKHALMNDMSKTLDDVNLQMDQDLRGSLTDLLLSPLSLPMSFSGDFLFTLEISVGVIPEIFYLAEITSLEEILVEVVSDGSATTFGGCLSSVQENGTSEKDSTFVLLEHSRSTLSTPGALSMNKGASRSCSSELSQSQVVGSPARDLDGSHGVYSIATRGSVGGLSGLLNLGNTCFMNSAIQCLVHTPEFARYFRDDYHQEINWQNPLGMVGELALAFGDLLRKLWAPGRSPVNPRPFKAKLARFAPQFSGYNQHDSQELLAFLLDGLHEDLNRVKHKPYINSKDADGRPDEEVADEYWANHIARNDSIIVDVCQGQYKSTLVCPVCGKVSVTFDPFMYLSLPLQSANTRSMTVMVFSSDGGSLPSPCTVTVPKHGRCRDLIQALSTSCSLQTGEKLLLAEIRGHLIHRFLEDPLILLSTIKDDDHIAAYRFLKSAKNIVYLQLIHRREESESNNVRGRIGWNPYGTPLVAPMSRDDVITRGDVQSIVHTMLFPMLRAETSQSGDPPKGVGDLERVDAAKTRTDIIMSPKLRLQLVDENNACIDVSVGEEKEIKLTLSSTNILVFIDWSNKDLELYDTHYIENLPEVCKYAPPAKKVRSEPLSLYSCLEAFLREEPLVPEDMWYCPQCKAQRQASKKLDLWRLPEVLVIHLKRFSYSRSMKHKLETFVNFPIHDFDLTNYVAHNNGRRQLYELYALSNHYGGMGSGHYTAHIKLLDENRWYNFDDSHISLINEEDVKSSAAYVLFYRRVKSEVATVSNGAQSCADHSNILSRK